MNTDERLAELRQAFDASFALPPVPRDDDVVDLLAVTADTSALAVPMAAMSGLAADRSVTPLPGSPPDLLGVAGLRGHLVPVYDLARVLDNGQARSATTVRWMVLAAGTPSFAVAVDRVDGHLRVPRDAIAEPVAGAHAATGPVVHTIDGPRPVVDLAAVRRRVTARAEAEET
jgi:chemotaxis signal transduction protein